MDLFTLRFKDNGVTGHNETLTLHVSKTKSGDEVQTGGWGGGGMKRASRCVTGPLCWCSWARSTVLGSPLWGMSITTMNTRPDVQTSGKVVKYHDEVRFYGALGKEFSSP